MGANLSEGHTIKSNSPFEEQLCDEAKGIQDQIFLPVQPCTADLLSLSRVILQTSMRRASKSYEKHWECTANLETALSEPKHLIILWYESTSTYSGLHLPLFNTRFQGLQWLFARQRLMAVPWFTFFYICLLQCLLIYFKNLWSWDWCLGN